MFWGLILKANKRYTQVLEKPFHLSLAALDHSTADDEPVQVMYSHEDRSYLLCTLQKGTVMQAMLDLNFKEGDKLCFLTKGNGIVHLTGFLIPEEEDDFADLDDMEDEEDEEMELPDLREKLKGKQQKEKEQKPSKAEEKANKKKPVEESPDEEEEDSSDENNDTSGVAEDDDDDDDSVDEEESDDDADDDEDEEESDDEEEEIQPPKKQAKIETQPAGKKEKQNGLSNGQEKKKEKNQKQQQQQQETQQKGPGQMQKLQGGLMYQDMKVGNGAEAKPGKKIQVYYEGKLKSNNKTFDSTKSGPGFKMILGRGEVIKGWDLGLQGMKVGGKRKLIVPPALGYGPRGNPPVIPANSTLVFDVELKNVF